MNTTFQTQLSQYRPTLNIGAGKLTQIAWYFTNIFFFKNTLNVSSSLKVLLLKIFGAKVGKGVVVKPGVNIKYPWKLVIGNYTWIGENVWIDNLVKVSLGSNVCISQGALLLTGNHNYKSEKFDLLTGEIVLEDGVWIGAKAIVCAGVVCHSHAMLAVASVASSHLQAYSIYRGNPAEKIKERDISIS
jgi:putative colanic acid biosynthesis acetyltransferase WcaF